MTPKSKYTYELLQAVVGDSFSFNEVLQKLNAGCNGSSFMHIKRKIENLNIDTSHFRHYVPTAPVYKTKKPINEILIHDERKSRRTETYQLKRALLESNIKYVCAVCGGEPMHNGIPLTLQIDHIDGNFRNNTIDNLRFICPNCHTQTNNYGNKSKNYDKRYKTYELYPDVILETIGSQQITSYKELAKALNIGIKKLMKYCKLYNITVGADDLDKDYIISVMESSSNLQEALGVLKISRWKYEKYKNKYAITINIKKRMWVTNGVEDQFIPTSSKLPAGFTKGKTKNRPPLKQPYKNK